MRLVPKRFGIEIGERVKRIKREIKEAIIVVRENVGTNAHRLNLIVAQSSLSEQREYFAEMSKK